MRFFARELQEQTNGDDMRSGLEEFERRFKIYYDQLAGLRPRMSAAAYFFFSKVNTHHATLLSAEFGDDIEERHVAGRTDVVNQRRIRVRLLLEDGRTAEIVYRRVRKAVFDYSMDDAWHSPERNAVDDLLNHELTDAGDGFMRHECLFSSGSTLLVELRDLTCRVRGRRSVKPGQPPSSRR